MFDYPLIGENSFINYQEFLTSGMWYKPKGQKYTKAWIMCIGGGGSGGVGSTTSCPGYGGAGGAISQRMVYLSNDHTITIGSGGAGYSTNASATGKTGGTTSFGSILNAKGGNGGTSSSGVLGGARELYNPEVYYSGYYAYYTDFYAQSFPGKGYSTAYPVWTYKRHSQYFANGTGESVTGYGGIAGHNGNGGNAPGGSPSAGSGAGSAGYRTSGTYITVGAGGSGYCIIFWEEELKQKKCIGNAHLKIQEFPSSGTWYRPTRFPATLAYVFLISTAVTPVWSFAPYFLTEDSYSLVVGNPSTFGSIDSTSFYAPLCMDCFSARKHSTSYTGATLRAWPIETLAPTTSFIMWYE